MDQRGLREHQMRIERKARMQREQMEAYNYRNQQVQQGQPQRHHQQQVQQQVQQQQTPYNRSYEQRNLTHSGTEKKQEWEEVGKDRILRADGPIDSTVHSEIDRKKYANGDDTFRDANKITKVTDGIYICGWNLAGNVPLLVETKIGAILALGGGKKPAELLQQYRNNGIVHEFITTITEDSKITDELEKIYCFIHTNRNENRNVLVHCEQGTSVSPVAVVSYLMKVQYMKYGNLNKDFTDTFVDGIKNPRPSVDINKNLLDQLRAYEKKLQQVYASRRM